VLVFGLVFEQTLCDGYRHERRATAQGLVAPATDASSRSEGPTCLGCTVRLAGTPHAGEEAGPSTSRANTQRSTPCSGSDARCVLDHRWVALRLWAALDGGVHVTDQGCRSRPASVAHPRREGPQRPKDHDRSQRSLAVTRTPAACSPSP
jgi:hypothetical protein